MTNTQDGTSITQHEASDTSMDINEVLAYLPHSYPFILVDKVLELDPGKSIKAVKNVTINEHFFAGHFPGNPVMPGVLILEALAQAMGLLALKTEEVANPDNLSSQKEDRPIYYFAGIDKVRFKRIVLPGDQLMLEINDVQSKLGVWRAQASAKVEGTLVCRAELVLARGRK